MHMKLKKDSKLSFLDVETSRKNKHSQGRNLSAPTTWKGGTLKTLEEGALNICSTPKLRLTKIISYFNVCLGTRTTTQYGL